MTRLLARTAAACLVAPFLTFASALAPPHVHAAGSDHDHGHAVAHSHFGPHLVDNHPTGDTEIEHDIEHVVWLDSPIVHESADPATRVPPAVVIRHELLRTQPHWAVTTSEGAAPAHGPPRRAHRLRGPPSLV